MKIEKLIYIVFIVIALISCKKEPLPELPEENEPYYSMQGYIDGEFVHYKVGQEGIKFSQGVAEKNGIKTYYGQLVSPSDDIVLKMEFTVPEKPNTASGKSPFKSNTIEFLVQQDGCKQFSFGSSIFQKDHVYVLDNSGSFVQTNEIEFSEYGIYTINVMFQNIGQDVHEIPINYGFKNAEVNSGFVLLSSLDTVSFVAYNQSGSHKWWLDGNQISTEAEFDQTVGLGVHKVRHEFTDIYGNISNTYSLFRINDFLLDWKMTVDNCAGYTGEENNYGKALISVTKDGQVFKSELAQSNINEMFSVSNIELVGNASNNPDWVVFDFQFESTLLNQSKTDSLSLTEMEGTFNVGLK